MKTIDFPRHGVLIFALATIAFGVQHFIYGEFVMGRAPAWPDGVAGREAWAYGSGVVLIGLGVTVALRRHVAAAFVIALMVFAWSLFRHLLAAHWGWGTEITQTGKALMLFGGALCTAAYSSRQGNSVKPYRLLLAGRICLGLFFIVCGFEHFMFVDFVKSLVPAWIPAAAFWTYLTGVALVAGGVGMMINATVRLAGILSGIMVFTWFLVLHIPRALASEGDGGNEWIAVVEALAVSGIAFMISGSSGYSRGGASPGRKD